MVHNSAPKELHFWVRSKIGFEIGGPSESTWGTFGVYDVVEKLDVINFASNTLWESGLTNGSPFVWKEQTKGKQYVRDAVDLKGIPDGYYDFVLASHVLEHIANPLKALIEWLRVTKPRGVLLLILPFKNLTFDHNRKVVSIEHLSQDYRNGTDETDLSHLDEILRLHDLKMDPPAGNITTFRTRSEKNFWNRGLHQHVYDQKLLYYIFVCLNLDVKAQYTWNIHQLIIGQKK